MAKEKFVYVVKYFGSIVVTTTAKKEAKQAVKDGLASKLRNTIGYTIHRYKDGMPNGYVPKDYSCEDFLND